MFAIKNYGMYEDYGNERIDILVENARAVGADWPMVLEALHELSKDSSYAEATDTEVRRSVYNALGFKTPFYV
jgi:hypothetical protein